MSGSGPAPSSSSLPLEFEDLEERDDAEVDEVENPPPRADGSARVVTAAALALAAASNALLIPVPPPPIPPAAPSASKLGIFSALDVLESGPALPLTSFSLSLAIGSRETNSLCSNWTTTKGRERCEDMFSCRAWMSLRWSWPREGPEAAWVAGDAVEEEEEGSRVAV